MPASLKDFVPWDGEAPLFDWRSEKTINSEESLIAFLEEAKEAGLGIGGLELGLHLAEPRANPVVFVEQDEFCQSILQRRWPGAFIWDNVLTFDGRPWLGCIDVFTAGFPCQPWSLAGERKGTADERWIFPQIGELIRQVGPEWVFLENVPALITGGGLALVLGTLADLGFDAAWGVFSCEQLGASHRRKRVFILAHSQSLQCGQGRPASTERSRAPLRLGQDVGHPDSLRGRGDRISDPGHSKVKGPDEAMADSDSPDLWKQPESIPRGERAAEPGWNGQDLADSHGVRRWGTLWERRHEIGRSGPVLADGDGERLSIGQEQHKPQFPTTFGSSLPLWAPGPGADWAAIPRELWPSEQPVRPVADGLPARVELSRRARVKALGNAVSPPVGAVAWCVLKSRLMAAI